MGLFGFIRNLFHGFVEYKEYEKMGSMPADNAGENLELGEITVEDFYNHCEACGVWEDLRINDETVRNEICEQVVAKYNTGSQTSDNFYASLIPVFNDHKYVIIQNMFDLLVSSVRDTYYDEHHEDFE